MIKNKFKLFILLLVSIFVLNSNVYAFSTTIGPIEQRGSAVTTNGHDKLALKHYGNTAVFCTEFKKESPAMGSATCSTVDNWSDAIKAGVASIIKKVGTVEITGSAPDNYYYGELAINEFLCNSGIETNYTCISDNRTANEVLGNYYSWYEDAIKVRDSYKEASIDFNVDSLEFTKNGDFFESNVFKVEKSFNDNYEIAVNLGELVEKQDGSGYYVKVDVSAVAPGKTYTVRVRSKISKKVDMAQNYNCGDDYQTVTPNFVEQNELKEETFISGTITGEEIKGSLVITKIDKETKEALSGVEFSLYSNLSCTSAVVKTVTTGTNGIATFNDLGLGAYWYKETKSKTGYKQNIACTKVEIKNATAVTKTVENEKIKGSLVITKIDKETKEALSGVEFSLYSNSSCTSAVVKTVTTGTNGIATFNDLGLGAYWYKETKSKTGYKQNIACTKVEIKNATAVTKTVENEKIKVNLKIQKVDSEDNKILPGAKLQLINAENKTISCTITGTTNKNQHTCEWVSGETAIEIIGLPIGTYYLVEIEAPIGYIKKDKKEIKLKGDKEVVEYTLKNDINSVEFSKIDATTEEELEGATLEIQDKDGNIVKLCTDSEGNKTAECKWVSTKEKHVIKGLPIGTYYLVETIAPEGYFLNKNKVKFEITEKGIDKPVVMKNEITQVEISKVNAVDGNELEGATLQLLDSDKKEMSCTAKKGIIGTESLEKCTWVSTKESKVILGLKPGKYYLVETIAPEGYVLSEKAIEVIVREDGTTDPVKMVNELEVDVPDTLSSRSALLIAISMFDIALGIGIITYVKTRKNQ